MPAFTAKDVQSLRQASGCGMMDCKKALTEADGDIDKATSILREKGLSAAAKKADRIAAEGIVHAVVDYQKNVGAVVEVNSETDFVAKNESFLEFVDNIAKTIIEQNPNDVETLLTLKLHGSENTVLEALNEKILVIGENMKIRRFARYSGVVATYIHGGGRIGVMLSIDTTPEIAANETFKACAKDIAMQVAAANPQFTNKEDVDPALIEKEKQILTAQAINEGKPANIAEKMVVGRIAKFYKEICLVEQPFVKNGDLTVAQYLDSIAKELGGTIKINSFVRFEKGEGLEKREDNFADEVASMMK